MFPKIDLHCHLDGSLSEDTLIRLAKRSHIILPENKLLLRQKITAPKDCQSLIQYLECFDLPVACLQTEENLFDAAKSVILEAAKEHVIYIEIRFAPLLHRQQGLTTQQIVKSVIDGMKSGVAKVNASGQMMAAGIILCGMRHMPPKENIQMLRDAAEFIHHGVCGADIAGSEADYPPMVQVDFFRTAAQMNLPFTIHAGECGSAANVYDAICLGAKRIGHGIALYQDKAIRKWVKEKGIALEMCPTSNLQTKAIDSWEHYPFRMFMDEKLKVTINTDNRTVSQTTMTNEFEILAEYCQMTKEEQKIICLNSIEAAFTSEAIKQQLKAYMQDQQ